MNPTRRQFVIVSSVTLAGCAGTPPQAVQPLVAPVDAGPISDYAHDGIYGNFRTQGFFLIRRGGQLDAVSAVCTHRACGLKQRPDRGFLCPCHGSTFDPAGHVTRGPATRDLPRYRVTIDANGHVIVAPMTVQT